MSRWKHNQAFKHIEIHELSTGYVVEYNTSAHSFADISQTIRFCLLLENDVEKRRQLEAQIADVFERVYKEE